MTTYTIIPDTALAQDKPLTQSIARALRDNPKALAEGDGTAPEVAGVSYYLKRVASNTPALVFPLPDGYDCFEFDIIGIYPVSTGSNQLVLEMSSDGGTTWFNTTYAYADDTGASASTWLPLSYSRTFTTIINGSFKLLHARSTTFFKFYEASVFWFNGASDLERIRSFGFLQQTGKINAVRIRFLTGNISMGYVGMRRVRPA